MTLLHLKSSSSCKRWSSPLHKMEPDTAHTSVSGIRTAACRHLLRILRELSQQLLCQHKICISIALRTSFLWQEVSMGSFSEVPALQRIADGSSLEAYHIMTSFAQREGRTWAAFRRMSVRQAVSSGSQLESLKCCGRYWNTGATLRVSALGSGTFRPATQNWLGPTTVTSASPQVALVTPASAASPSCYRQTYLLSTALKHGRWLVSVTTDT